MELHLLCSYLSTVNSNKANIHLLPHTNMTKLMSHSICWEMNIHGPPTSDQNTIVSVTQYEWSNFVHLTDAFLVAEYEKFGGNWMWYFKRLHNPAVERTLTITGTLMYYLPLYVGLVTGPGEGDLLFCYYSSTWEYINMLT